MNHNFSFNNNDSTILIVEDQQYTVRVLEEILKRENYKYRVASNASEAYKLLKAGLPDLILLDIMMHGEDGFEFCANIKQNNRFKDIPVIFLTAKAELEDKIHGFELGAVDYITKPFNALEIIARITTHIQNKKSKDFIKSYNKELESIIEQRTQELMKSEKQAIFGQLIQGIIHNIRGPIASVISSFQLITFYREDLDAYLKKKPELLNGCTEKFKEIWNVIAHDEKMLMKLTKTIDAMMIKSRSDKSKVLENVDLNDVLRQEIEFLNADMLFNKIDKDIILYDKPLNIKVIPGEIGQVFSNIVNNSLDAMYNCKDSKITVVSGISDKFCWFSVADNGLGIPQDIINKIFDPFFTTKKSRRGDEVNGSNGAGIGLHFSKQTAESYGGKVEVSSIQGEGAEFKVYIPAAEILVISHE